MKPTDAPQRLHTSSTVDDAEAHLIVNWPEGTPVADIEQAVKDAARAAIRRARTVTRQHQ